MAVLRTIGRSAARLRRLDIHFYVARPPAEFAKIGPVTGLLNSLTVYVQPFGELRYDWNWSLRFRRLWITDCVTPHGSSDVEATERVFVLRRLVGFPREPSQFSQAQPSKSCGRHSSCRLLRCNKSIVAASASVTGADQTS
jgi:hypothetical protein